MAQPHGPRTAISPSATSGPRAAPEYTASSSALHVGLIHKELQLIQKCKASTSQQKENSHPDTEISLQPQKYFQASNKTVLVNISFYQHLYQTNSYQEVAYMYWVLYFCISET